MSFRRPQAYKGGVAKKFRITGYQGDDILVSTDIAGSGDITGQNYEYTFANGKGGPVLANGPAILIDGPNRIVGALIPNAITAFALPGTYNGEFRRVDPGSQGEIADGYLTINQAVRRFITPATEGAAVGESDRILTS